MGKIIAVVLSLPMAIPQPLHMTTTYAEDNVSENTVVETAEPTETAGSEQSAQDSETASPEAQSTSETTSAVTSEAADNQIAEQNEGTGVDVVTAAQPTAAPRARAPIMRAASTPDLTGTAYAVFNSSTKEFDFIRSTETHKNGSTGSVTSISGNTYTGTIYAGFETNKQPYTSSTWSGHPLPWLSIVNQVKNIKFIDAIRPLHCDYWFYNMTKCTDIDVAKLDTSCTTSMLSMFGKCSSLTSLDLESFDTSNVTDMQSMFSKCSSLKSLNVENFDTSNVTGMSSMFYGCSSLTSLDLKNFDTANALYMDYMFSGCSSLTSLNLEKKFDTSNVTSMAAMFDGCSSLTSLDLGKFNTANVTNICFMFDGCSSLTSLDVKGFDTAKVQDMGYMFRNCSSLTSLDVGNFNTANVIGMDGIFSGCPYLSLLTFGSNFKIPSSFSDVFSTPTTYSGKPSTGNWGLGSEQADSSKTADELAEYGTTSGALKGTWYAQAETAYSITYNLNGGSISGNPTTYYSTSSAIKLNNPTRTGYTFAGWTGSNGDTPQTEVAIQTGSTGNKSYTANWTPNTYKVTYDANGGSGSMSNDTATYGTSFTAKANGFTRPGYEFAGWTENADGTGSNWTDWIGRPWTWTYTRSITLYAQWKAHVGTITYNANGGMIGTTSETRWSIAKDGTILLDGKAYQVLNGPGYDETLIYGTQYDLVNANNQAWLNLVRTGYHVKSGEEWNTHTDGAGASFNQGLKYTAQQFISALETTDGATATVYANWEPNTYTVKFNANNGTGMMADEAMTYDVAKSLTANTYARKGYIFTGWNRQPDGKGASYTDKASVKNLTSTNDGTVTLYAQWQANTYTVSIPRAVKYEGMLIGKVNVATPYDVTVKCKAGTFADTIEVRSSASPMTATGGSNDLSVSSDSSKTPLVFTKEGTQQDHVVISGTTATADKWTGSIQYTVSEK